MCKKNGFVLRVQTGKRLEENKLRSKQKAADTKKIQDLERQVSASFFHTPAKHLFLPFY